MKWNWQQPDWPHFRYDKELLQTFETSFLRESGFLLGLTQYLYSREKSDFTVEMLSDEAYKTSEIEGEYLNRDSLRSSIRHHLGLPSAVHEKHKSFPAEQGIAQLMVQLHQQFMEPLSHEILFDWHLMLTVARYDLRDVGHYRTHNDSMQIVSGYSHRLKVHFEAPPSKQVLAEMEQFICWFNHSTSLLPPLIRAGIAHLYFACIHPFEDGNGRIARALTEKALSQYLEAPTFIALSTTIQKDKKAYYDALGLINTTNDITPWLVYFSKTILSAQIHTQLLVKFLIKKARFYYQHKDQMNPRQEKVIARLFEAGIEGFKGGLSVENYLRITGTSRATATRDLQELVNKNMLRKSGALKSTRYALLLEPEDIEGISTSTSTSAV